MNHILLTLRSAVTAMVLATPLLSAAQTTATDAWVRATVPQQKATGLFATLTSAKGGKLVGASSPVAGVVEVHEMAMQGDVMRMRAVPALVLPAGKPVELRPGGYHVMLMDLKKPIHAGDTVALTLRIQGADGKVESLDIKAPARALGPPAAPGAGMAGHGAKH